MYHAKFHIWMEAYVPALQSMWLNFMFKNLPPRDHCLSQVIASLMIAKGDPRLMVVFANFGT